MDNLQFWIYVIVVVIYLVGRAMKKKPEQPTSQGRPDQPTGSGGKRPMTFEELLREITESKSTTTQPQPKKQPSLSKPLPKPQPTYVDYDDDIKDEIEDLEDVDYSYKEKDNLYEVYEEAKRQAFQRPSLEDSTVEHKELKYGRFDEFSSKKKKTILDDYVAELRNPSGFKKAVIMSEILNRRF